MEGNGYDVTDVLPYYFPAGSGKDTENLNQKSLPPCWNSDRTYLKFF
jgi:hypothetical protein